MVRHRKRRGMTEFHQDDMASTLPFELEPRLLKDSDSFTTRDSWKGASGGDFSRYFHNLGLNREGQSLCSTVFEAHPDLLGNELR